MNSGFEQMFPPRPGNLGGVWRIPFILGMALTACGILILVDPELLFALASGVLLIGGFFLMVAGWHLRRLSGGGRGPGGGGGPGSFIDV